MKLHDQVTYWKAQATMLSQSIDDVKRYARTDKFNGVNNGINRDDILRRFEQSHQEIINKQFEDFGEYRTTELDF